MSPDHDKQDKTVEPTRTARKPQSLEAEQKATAEKVLGDDPEVAQEIIDWQQATYLLIGTLMMQQGKRAARITVAELEKFRAKNALQFKQTADGTLHYSVRPIKK